MTRLIAKTFPAGKVSNNETNCATRWEGQS